jgi:hypothetical protein
MIIDAFNCNNANVLHKGENHHSKSTEKEQLEKSHREQKILLKENKQKSSFV